METRIQVSYFALLREQAGQAAQEITTRARTVRELYEELRQQHRFSLPPERLRAAINDEFASWDAPLSNGQHVAFIPPVSGG